MKERILKSIFQKMPTQEKRLWKTWEEFPEASEELDEFLQKAAPVLDRYAIDAEQIAQAYLTMAAQTMEARLEFMRTGRYPAQWKQVVAELYAEPSTMLPYVWALALTQFIWRQHILLRTFYQESLSQIQEPQRLLEIGSGHGLYAVLAMKRLEAKPYRFDIVDISETALEVTKAILQAWYPQQQENVFFSCQDITASDPPVKYDWITMGEVLEHVPEPLALLQALRSWLQPAGRLFITTCANSPTIDHVYQFHTIQEIRELLQQAGFQVEKECVAPSEDKTLAWMEKRKLDVSYAAVLSLSR